MVKVCPDCRATCMGGQLCKRCGGVLTDVGDRSKREDVAGLGISIRALYAARAAMVLSCAGFLFGAMFSLAFDRRSFGAGGPIERGFWWLCAAAVFGLVWWGMTRLGKFHFDRTLAANRERTGLSGAEDDFFPDGEYDHST
jgi:hypothetical protein